MVKITRGRCCPQISNCTAKNAGFLEMKRKKIGNKDFALWNSQIF